MTETGKAAVRAQFNHAEEIPSLVENDARLADQPQFDPTETVLDDIEVTEDGVAREFVRRYGNRVRFDHVAGKWFLWTGDHWKKDDTAQAFQWSRELARQASTGSGGSELKNARKASFASGVERLARADQAVAVTSEAWDSDLNRPGFTGEFVVQ